MTILCIAVALWIHYVKMWMVCINSSQVMLIDDLSAFKMLLPIANTKINKTLYIICIIAFSWQTLKLWSV